MRSKRTWLPSMRQTTGYCRSMRTKRSAKRWKARSGKLRKTARHYDAYTVPRLAQYMGRWILHSGWYPDRKIRLYNRRKAHWVGDFVHESVKVDGKRRASGVRSAAFHVRFVRRAFQDHGSIYYACSGADRIARQAHRHEATAARSTMDFRRKRISSSAVFRTVWRDLRSRTWPRFTILLSTPRRATWRRVANPQEDPMRVLHLDSGKEMRGGQWQVLSLAKRAWGGERSAYPGRRAVDG